MAASRRQFILGASAASIACAPRAAELPGWITPEMFGAKGDGRTNDTQAFAAMSAHINANGGGTINLRRTVYIVGEQSPGPGGRQFAFVPADIILLQHCTLPITINGNGATLRSAPGLRYGRFDPSLDRPLPDPEKLDLTNKAVPYNAVIYIKYCSGGITITDLELDGNLPGMRIGGKAAPNGWAAGGSGMWLYGNSGPETLSRIHSHHQPADGLILTPAANRIGSTTVSDLISEYNGRQGCSVTGGHDFVFQNCAFRHIGKAVLRSPSAPGSGVDVEAETSPIRNVVFSNCEFSDCTGFGFVCGSGDSADISFTGCKFVGTTNLAAYPDSPGVRFSNCLFVGTINHEHGSADPAQATQFLDCTFTDDPSLSPTGQVYLAGGGKWIAIARPAPNVRFSRCHFRLVDQGVLPLSGNDVIYADCDMSQRSPRPSGPAGTYIGTNTIDGNAHLEGSIVRGTVILNGRVLPPTA